MVIRAIIFDCFGVLVGSSHQTLLSLCPTERRIELMDASTSADYGYIDRETYEQRVAQIIGRDLTEVHDIISQKRIRNESLIAYAAQLHREYKTALLSNVGSNVIDRIFERDELDSLFDTIVLSYEVGMIKPNDDIYRLTAERLGLPPAACLMVDDREDFCAGADAAGMQALQFFSNDQVMSEVARKLAEAD